jgi:hypothetical protein
MTEEEKTKQEIIQYSAHELPWKGSILSDVCSTKAFHYYKYKKCRNTVCFSHDTKNSIFHTFRNQTNVSLHRRYIAVVRQLLIYLSCIIYDLYVYVVNTVSTVDTENLKGI